MGEQRMGWKLYLELRRVQDQATQPLSACASDTRGHGFYARAALGPCEPRCHHHQQQQQPCLFRRTWSRGRSLPVLHARTLGPAAKKIEKKKSRDDAPREDEIDFTKIRSRYFLWH